MRLRGYTCSSDVTMNLFISSCERRDAGRQGRFRCGYIVDRPRYGGCVVGRCVHRSFKFARSPHWVRMFIFVPKKSYLTPTTASDRTTHTHTFFTTWVVALDPSSVTTRLGIHSNRPGHVPRTPCTEVPRSCERRARSPPRAHAGPEPPLQGWHFIGDHIGHQMCQTPPPRL